MMNRSLIFLSSIFPAIYYGLFTNVSVLIVYIISLCIICIVNLAVKNNLLLSFVLGNIVAIFFHEYNMIIYKNYYYQGLLSDDYNYEQESFYYFSRNGINFRYLYDDLGVLHNSVGYVYLLTLLRVYASWISEYNPFIPKIFNLLILQLSALYIYKICVNIYSVKKNTSKIVATLFAVSPCLISFSSNIFRDIIVGFLVIIFFYYANCIKKNKYDLLIVFAIIFIMFFFRKYIVGIMLMLLPFFIFNINRLKIKHVLLVVAFLISFFLVFMDDILLVQNSIDGYKELNTERFGYIYSKILNLPIYIGIVPRMTFLLLNPLPVLEASQLFSSISTIITLILLPYLVKTIICVKDNFQLKISFFIFFIGVSISTFSFRHIVMFLPFEYILIAISFDSFKLFSKEYFKYMRILIGFVSISLFLILL